MVAVYPLFKQSHRTSFQLPTLHCWGPLHPDLHRLGLERTLKPRRENHRAADRIGENMWKQEKKQKLLAGTIGCSGYSYTSTIKYTCLFLPGWSGLQWNGSNSFKHLPEEGRGIGRWHDRSLLLPSYGLFIHTILALSAEDEEGNAVQGHPWHTLRTGTAKKRQEGVPNHWVCVKMLCTPTPNG